MPPVTDIRRALDRMAARAPSYRLYREYYDGDQPLRFATEKFYNAFGGIFSSLAYNFCEGVVDALSERLIMEGFAPEDGTPEAAGERAWEIWNRNRMDLRAGVLHTEAAKVGDAFVIVWPDRDGLVTIHPQSAENVTVWYDDPEEPDRITMAAKVWSIAGGQRVNLYYPDRIEKYVNAAYDPNISPANEGLRFVSGTGGGAGGGGGDYKPWEVPGELWPVPNPYGQVPVFHFANSAGVHKFGRSEIKVVKPIQDALNKIGCDMLVSMEYNAYRQRWATGLEIEIDEATGKPRNPFVAGPGQVWVLENTDAKFGEFSEVKTDGYLAAMLEHQRLIAIVSSTPLHYIIPMTDPPSGEALKTLEGKFVRKVEKRMTSFGNVWEDVMQFCLRVDGEYDGARLSAKWVPAETRSELIDAQIAQIADALGLPPEETWKIGFGLTPDEIADLLAAKAARQAEQDAQRLAAMQARQMAVGGTTPMPDGMQQQPQQGTMMMVQNGNGNGR